MCEIWWHFSLTGNNNIHALTSGASSSLYVRVKDFGDIWKHAEYSEFSIGDEASGYVLTVSGYSGDAGKHSGVWTMK